MESFRESWVRGLGLGFMVQVGVRVYGFEVGGSGLKPGRCIEPHRTAC